MANLHLMDDDAPRAAHLNINDAATWPEFLSVDEVAAILRVTPATVNRRVREGFIRSSSVVGSKHRRIRKSDLLNLLEE